MHAPAAHAVPPKRVMHAHEAGAKFASHTRRQEGAMQFLQQLTHFVPASYAESPLAHSVEFWVLLIAAGVVLIEWIVSRR